MAKTYTITIAGAVFKDAMNMMRLRMMGFIKAQDAVPFQLFFDHFSLTAENAALKRKLLARRSFECVAKDRYVNHGKTINHTLKNVGPDLDEVALYVPRDLSLSTVIVNDTLGVTFDGERPLIELSRVPPELGIGRRFLFDLLKWDDTGARYRFSQEDDHTNVLEIFVDCSKDANVSVQVDGMPLGLRTRLRFASAQLMRSGGCCSGFQAQDPPPSGPLCFNLHAKILVQPTISVEDQVKRVSEAFAPADIKINLASVELLNLPLLVHLDIGRCWSGETTVAQNDLFSHRRNAAPNDVCAYWVSTMTSADGTTVGCAAHQPGIPALALMGRSFMTPWVLAHELGHVLGLSHVDYTEQNTPSPMLMHNWDNYTDPPPDLTDQERGAMRISGFNAGILTHC